MNQDKRQRNEESPPYDICERTFQFATRIVKLCRRVENGWIANGVLGKQMLRSGTSIGANLEEGQAAQSRADFVSKYSIARKEARETNYWLRLITASGVSNDPEIPPLISETEQLVKILTTIIKNAKRD